MAHGDYDCCAICDNKQSYNGYDAATKEEICSDCLVALRELDVNVLTVKELLDWLKTEKSAILKDNLARLGFGYCYYENPIDSEVKRRRLVRAKR